ncbi:MAG: D-alanine--D-alanine ligase [Sphaerobacter thermophilus]|uniref:D-alanine--D-alanine ligase n=1 Tax=Sphaerobacter thermophilus TaxID=2057 RepID=UPI0023539DE8
MEARDVAQGARKIRVGVIFGGRSGEHDVSLRSAQAILRAIDRERFEVVPIGITREGRWLSGGDPLRQLAATSRLALAPGDDPPAEESDLGSALAVPETGHAVEVAGAGVVQQLDVVFPVLHGPYGEDGTVQGLLELADVPYVGAGVLGSAVSMDKVVAKQLFEREGLPVAPWLWVTRRQWERDPEGVAARVERELGYPCFVKPANLGSSVGVSKVHHPGELPGAMEEAARYDRKLVVERGIDARELEVSVLGNDEPITSVVGEIRPVNEFYDYQAKYVDEGSELLVPAPITQEQSDTVREMAVRAFKVVDAAGMARVDFFLERNTGTIYINEINTIPGFTQISMYPILWEASGLPFRELVTRLIELALERHAERRDGSGV